MSKDLIGYFSCDPETGAPVWDEGCVCGDNIFSVEGTGTVGRPIKFADTPVSAEPVAYGWDCDGALVKTRATMESFLKDGVEPIQLFAAPVAAQPDLTQQTLDDVMAGIPAREAEIAELRKQVETLQAQLVDRSTEMQRNLVDETPNLQSQQQTVSGADGFDAWIKREYPWLGPIGNGVVIAKEAWSAALAQQDADKVDEDPLQGVADWMVKDCGVKYIAELARRLSIGYNRATRLMEAARKENSNA